ncbi:MAG: hypothetical protein ACREFP_18680 [Acetobacteraceae bacterium]
MTRAGENPADYAPSFGETLAELRAAPSAAEALIAPPGPLAASLPLAAPALQLIFCTTASVNALAPFERIPRRVALVCNRGKCPGLSFRCGWQAVCPVPGGPTGSQSLSRGRG